MSACPGFPNFKAVELVDRDYLQKILWQYQPETCELTFTNLFIWRSHYNFHWAMHKDWLLLICVTRQGPVFGLEPVGPANRSGVVRELLTWLKEEKGQAEPAVERADIRLVEEIRGTNGLKAEPVREDFDYLYLRENLVKLPGRKYHAKRNHISQFLRNHSYTYVPVTPENIPACREMAHRWCQYRRCDEDMGLYEERDAVRSALENFDALKIQGGALVMEGRVEAFALGEHLNQETAVVHIEKANPEIPGLYALVNQVCAEKTWDKARYINREEDLDDEGLRRAKLSYHPTRLVEKFRIKLIGP